MITIGIVMLLVYGIAGWLFYRYRFQLFKHCRHCGAWPWSRTYISDDLYNDGKGGVCNECAGKWPR